VCLPCWHPHAGLPALPPLPPPMCTQTPLLHGSSPSKTEESWISRMAEASTMFLTMKRLMALSLGTITPEASQRTRRTCSSSPHTPQRQLLLLLLTSCSCQAPCCPDRGLTRPLPCLLRPPAKANNEVSREQREKRPGRHHQGWSCVCDRSLLPRPRGHRKHQLSPFLQNNSSRGRVSTAFAAGTAKWPEKLRAPALLRHLCFLWGRTGAAVDKKAEPGRCKAEKPEQAAKTC
jgi:hypothetical protein